MNFKPRFPHDLDDDSAPVDYTCVSSVSEGVRIQRAQKIHSEDKNRPSAPILRHRAEPDGQPVVDAYGTRARRTSREQNPISGRVMSRLPSAADGPAPAQSVAYPEDYGIPDDPFSPPPETQQPSRRTRSARYGGEGAGGPAGEQSAQDADAAQPAQGAYASQGARDTQSAAPMSRFAPAAQAADAAQPAQGAQGAYASQGAWDTQNAAPASRFAPAAQPTDAMPTTDAAHPAQGARIAMPSDRPVITSEDGSQFEPPVRPEMPEWLRVAQQNNMPLRRPEGPRVQAAAPVEAQEPAPVDLLGRPIRNRASAERARREASPQPQSVEAYREAGYPAELIAQQEQMEREQAAQPVRRRHGAQFAVNQYRQQEYEQSTQTPPSYASYPPSREAYAQSQRAPQTPAPGAAREYAPASAPAREYAPAQNREQPAHAAACEYAPASSPAREYAPAQSQEQPPRGSQAPAPGAVYASSPAYASAPARGASPARGAAYASAARMERGYTHPVRISAQPGYDGADAPLAPQERWQEETQEDWQEIPEEEQRRIRVPWLAIAAFSAALIAVALWLMGMSFQSQTEQVLEERRAAQEAVEKQHPLYFEELIAQKANKYNLSPAFVAAIMLNESSFRTDATSSVNARGLMQLMDDTASWIHDKMNLDTVYNFDDLYDAQTNVEYGCWYLNYLSGYFLGDPVLVAAGFHAGQNEVRNWLNDSRYSRDGATIALESLPDGPTKQYVTRVINDFAAYKRLYYENTEDDA